MQASRIDEADASGQARPRDKSKNWGTAAQHSRGGCQPGVSGRTISSDVRSANSRHVVARSAGNGSSVPMNRPGQHERRLAVDIGQGPVGREPDDDIASPEGDVIAADRFERHWDSVSAGRPETNCYSRHSSDGFDDPDQLRRTEGPVEIPKSRREIGDFDRGPLRSVRRSKLRRCCARCRKRNRPCRPERRR
jgi:hypothetical protein